MRILKNPVAVTMATVLCTGFALAADKEKGKRKGKGQNKAKAAKVESGTADLDALTKSLGFDEKALQQLAESLGAENGEALAETGAKLLGQFLSTKEGQEAGKALAETGAKLLGGMMSGDGGGARAFDLSGLLGSGVEVESGVEVKGKAIIVGPDGEKHEIQLGKGGQIQKALMSRHRHGDDENEGGDDDDDAELEALEEIAEQMKRQNQLLEEILERLEK